MIGLESNWEITEGTDRNRSRSYEAEWVEGSVADALDGPVDCGTASAVDEESSDGLLVVRGGLTSVPTYVPGCTFTND